MFAKPRVQHVETGENETRNEPAQHMEVFNVNRKALTKKAAQFNSSLEERVTR